MPMPVELREMVDCPPVETERLETPSICCEIQPGELAGGNTEGWTFDIE
jgi:hypothetical protein